MSRGFRIHKKRFAVFLHDLVWVLLAVTAAYYLRFNFQPIPETNLDGYVAFLVAAAVVHALTFWFYGCYRGVWRFASIPDFMRLTAAVMTGALVTVTIVFLYNRLDEVPRTVLVLYPVLLLSGVGGIRVAYRAMVDHGWRLDLEAGIPAIIVGAGRAGEILLRDLRRHGPYRPVAMVDDDATKHGQDLHGVRIVGGVDEIGEIARRVQAHHVLVAISHPPADLFNRILAQALDYDLKVSRTPTTTLLDASEPASIALRPVTVEDLLGREPVDLDDDGITEIIGNHSILVTGGGGSIGAEVCRQVAAHSPRRLVVFDNSEFNLYRIEVELRREFPELDVRAVLGSVVDLRRVSTCMEANAVDMVFHAAAYKHVPLVEDNPCEAARNNVIGTRTVADAAIRNGVQKFVLISTDKVVNPTSVMGASKRAAELYCQSLGSRSGTQFITTRFGNVLGSCGSVVPLFEQQIESGGPVTVTDPEVTRYFMTIDEAAGLILQASAIGQGGEIFVMDMGKAVRIQDLAEKMIRLYGKVPGRDISIKHTGLRPGEKLHEALFYEQEELVGTSHPKLLLANCFPASQQWLEGEMHALEEVVALGDARACVECLQRIVPDFRPYQREISPVDPVEPPVSPLRVVK